MNFYPTGGRQPEILYGRRSAEVSFQINFAIKSQKSVVTVPKIPHLRRAIPPHYSISTTMLCSSIIDFFYELINDEKSPRNGDFSTLTEK